VGALVLAAAIVAFAFVRRRRAIAAATAAASPRRAARQQKEQLGQGGAHGALEKSGDNVSENPLMRLGTSVSVAQAAVIPVRSASQRVGMAPKLAQNFTKGAVRTPDAADYGAEAGAPGGAAEYGEY
jgi:hypothetical protein